MAGDGSKKTEPKEPASSVGAGESTEAEHEVTHSDELSVDVNVGKLTGSQKRLWVMVLIGVVVLVAGGFTLYRLLEGEGPNEAEFTSKDIEEAEPSRGYVVYALEPSGGVLRDYYASEQVIEDRSVAQVFSSSQVRNGFQVSSSGQSYAAQASEDTIFSKNGDSELTHSLGGLSDWILIPDGTRVYALADGNLHTFDTTTGESRQVADNFALSGDATGLLYARDGTVRQYAKSGLEITEAHYNTKNGEATSRTNSVIRFDELGPIVNASLSPDGTSLLFLSNIDGINALQLLSLNSFVLRTVFVSNLPGGVPTSFSWSEDSNNIVVNVSGNGVARLTNLKVGTLEKVIVLEQDGSGSRFDSPRWSPDKTQISYIQDGTLKVVTVEGGEIVDAIDSIPEDAYTGWFLD